EVGNGLGAHFAMIGGIAVEHKARPPMSAAYSAFRPQHSRVERGFTLIEILVVVVILGILAAVVVPKVMEHPGEARQVRARQDVQAILTALNTYKLDNYTYPSTEQGVVPLVRKPSGSPEAPNWHQYLEKLPVDP